MCCGVWMTFSGLYFCWILQDVLLFGVSGHLKEGKKKKSTRSSWRLQVFAVRIRLWRTSPAVCFGVKARSDVRPALAGPPCSPSSSLPDPHHLVPILHLLCAPHHSKWQMAINDGVDLPQTDHHRGTNASALQPANDRDNTDSAVKFLYGHQAERCLMQEVWEEFISPLLVPLRWGGAPYLPGLVLRAKSSAAVFISANMLSFFFFFFFGFFFSFKPLVQNLWQTCWPAAVRSNMASQKDGTSIFICFSNYLLSPWQKPLASGRRLCWLVESPAKTQQREMLETLKL